MDSNSRQADRERPPLLSSAWIHYDFCPWANRYVDWLKQPIGWFAIAAAASLAIGLTLAPQGLVMFAAITAFILLGVAWPWIEMRGLTCRLRFMKGRLREEESVRVRLDVVNRWPWPVRGLAVERGFLAEADSGGNPTDVALARVPGWSQSTFYWVFHPPRRGVYPAERPMLSTGFPFGIWHARREALVAGKLIVWPQTIRLDSVPPVSGRDFTVAGMLSEQVGNEGDVLGVRPYRQGDSLRKVHWAQTARHDQLIVCERQATAGRTVRVTIDTNGKIHRGSSTQGSLEWAIRLGATLSLQFHAHNSRVECVVEGQRLIAEPGPLGIQRLLDGLARYVPGDAGRETSNRKLTPNAGMLSILVTTDLGLECFARNVSTGGIKLVVLNAAGFDEIEGNSFHFPETGYSTAGAWIQIGNSEHAAADFRRQWERICHDVWRSV